MSSVLLTSECSEVVRNSGDGGNAAAVLVVAPGRGERSVRGRAGRRRSWLLPLTAFSAMTRAAIDGMMKVCWRKRKGP